MNSRTPTKTSSHGTHIAFCVDHRSDSRIVQAMLQPWICACFESSNEVADHSFIEHTAGDGDIFWSSLNWSRETAMQIVLTEHGPTPSHIRWMLDTLELRTGVRTLQPFSEFDKGFLTDFLLKETTRRPPGAILSQSKASLLKLALELRLKADVVLFGIERFDK